MLRGDGRIETSDKPAPWIARGHLNPGPEASLVGEVETSDEWLQRDPFAAETWADAMGWFDRYWAAVTAGEMPDGYIVADGCRIDVLTQRGGAGRHLLKLYDHLLVSDVRHPLLERFCLGGSPPTPVTTRLRAEWFAAGP